MIRVFIDGASKNNPGLSGAGVVLYRNSRKIKELSVFLGKTTNNCAEYASFILGLQEVVKLGEKKASFYSDSQLLVNQINGIYKIKNQNLFLLQVIAKNLISALEEFKIEFIDREENKEADNLANLAVKKEVSRIERTFKMGVHKT